MAVVCGNCTDTLGKCLGSVVRHETVAEVKDCFDRKYAWDLHVEENPQIVGVTLENWADNLGQQIWDARHGALSYEEVTAMTWVGE